MKRKIVMALSLIMVLIMVGCGAKNTGYGTPVAGGANMPNNNEKVDTEKIQEAIVEDEVVNSNTFDFGVSLAAKDITTTGLTLVFTQSGGNSIGELQTGSDYSIERKVGDYWEGVEFIIPSEELAWTQEAYGIEKGGTFEMKINWTYLYGELEPGFYRVSKSIMNFRNVEDCDSANVYVEFEIK